MSIICSMIVRNEGGNAYFRRAIDAIHENVDRIMILDDKSDDDNKTKMFCLSYPKIFFKESPFDVPMYPINEPKLREVQWEETRKLSQEGDWILALDADEEMECLFPMKIEELMKADCDWYRFRLLDMWDENSYRTDGYWSPVKEVFFRYKDLPAELPQGNMHIPLLPKYILDSQKGIERRDVRIIHWGWANEKKRLEKQKFYLDGRAEGVNLEHAKSITDPATLKEYAIEN
jgi:hypothetical protein